MDWLLKLLAKTPWPLRQAAKLAAAAQTATAGWLATNLDKARFNGVDILTPEAEQQIALAGGLAVAAVITAGVEIALSYLASKSGSAK